MAPQDDDRSFTADMIATDDHVRLLLLDMRNWLTDRQTPVCLCGTVELVMAEVLNNVVEHAFAGLEPGQVRVVISARPAHFSIRVCDRGQPMPATGLPDKGLPDCPESIANLPEGGWGWFLIHSLTRELTYLREDGENLLCFEIPDNAGLAA